jgi:hypothetical protein
MQVDALPNNEYAAEIQSLVTAMPTEAIKVRLTIQFLEKSVVDVYCEQRSADSWISMDAQIPWERYEVLYRRRKALFLDGHRPWIKLIIDIEEDGNWSARFFYSSSNSS